MSKNKRPLNRALRLFIVSLLVGLGLVPATSALATTSVAVSMPSKIVFNPADADKKLTSISVTGSASYVQLDIQVTDLKAVPVSETDSFRLAVGDKCAFDAGITNPATGGSVVFSGDNSTELLMAGTIADLNYALQDLWLFNSDSNHCNATAHLGQEVVARKIKIAAIETVQGVWWSSYTKHYYKLATQTTSDGMGQPTDDQGNITDGSRYFVKWTTARAAAKDASSNLTISGKTYNGYLANITTEPEYKFLNNNVSGNGQDVFPAWVGGTDLESEGTWNWVDGPEALTFGGDTLTRMGEQDPQGNIIQGSGESSFIRFGIYNSYATSALLARDAFGNEVPDTSGYKVALNLANYCNDYINRAEDIDGYEVDVTPYGGRLVCQPGNEYILDDSNNVYYSEGNAIYLLFNWLYAENEYGDNLVVRVGSSDTSPIEVANYRGAQFWGPSWTYPPYFNPCWQRGARGVCRLSQYTADGSENLTNNYYVHWSNGDLNSYGNWDGTGTKAGDGLYNAQPDNAGIGSNNEGALIINWCSRNSINANHTQARQQTLYGNTGYYCTPGWNDLPADQWNNFSENYAYNQSADTPNRIGTTDFVVEYCGYVDQMCEAPAGATASTRFTIDDVSEPLLVSFEQAQAQQTSLQSATLQTENFDSVSQGWCDNCSISSSLGTFTGSQYTADPGIYGGAGGVGKLYGPSDVIFTPNVSQRYFGLWWSAGSPGNFIEFLDSAGNTLLTFNTADLVNQLGSCSGNPYCGNPNPEFLGQASNELFVFVNFRIDGGYSAVRLSGPGFETDNITISETAPARSASETLVTTNVVQSDCSNLSVSDLELNLTACPQQATASVGQSQTLTPLSISPLAGYSYPAEASISAVSVYSGTCSSSLTSSTTISAVSDTAGNCILEYTITNGNQSSTSRITVTFTAGGTASIQTPVILPVDPRALTAFMPQLPITADQAVGLCFIEATDSSGTTAATSDLIINLSGSVVSVSVTANGSNLLLSGSANDLSSATASISISRLSGSRLTSGGAVFIKVGVMLSSAPDSAACESATFNVIRIEQLGVNLLTTYIVQVN